MSEKLKWFLLGIVVLIGAKYLVLGLDAWNNLLHPGRTEPHYLRPFKDPLLGLTSRGPS